MSKARIVAWAKSAPEFDANTVAALLRSYAQLIERHGERGLAAFYIFGETFVAGYRAAVLTGPDDVPPLE